MHTRVFFFIAEREILNSSFRWRHGATGIKGCATSSTESRIQYLMLYELCTWFLLDWCGKIWGRPSMVFIHTACCLTKKLHLSVWNLLLLIFMLVTPTQNNCMIEQESCTRCAVAHHVLSIQPFMAASLGFIELEHLRLLPKIQRICPSLLQEVARLPMKKRNRIDSPFNALTSKLQTSNMPPQQSSNCVSYYPHLERSAFNVYENPEKAATHILAMVWHRSSIVQSSQVMLYAFRRERCWTTWSKEWCSLNPLSQHMWFAEWVEEKLRTPWLNSWWHIRRCGCHHCAEAPSTTLSVQWRSEPFRLVNFKS